MSSGTNASSNNYGGVSANQKSGNHNIQMTAQHSGPPPPNDSMVISSPSYSNSHQVHYNTGAESPQYTKERGEQVHISVYNSPQHYQQQQRLAFNSGSSTNSEKIPQGKYTSHGARSNSSSLPERRNMGRDSQEHNRQPQIYSTYPATQIQSPQLVPAGSMISPLMHSHQMLNQSPQSHNQNAKDIANTQSPMSHQQRQSSQQSELTQQLGASPVVSIQQSISLQNPAFQIQQRSGPTGQIRDNISHSNASIKSIHHHQMNISQQPMPHQMQHLPQSPGCQIVQQQHSYIPPSPLSQQSQSAGGRLSSSNIQPQTPDGISSNVQLSQRGNGINDGSSHSVHSMQEISQQHQAAPPQPIYHAQPQQQQTFAHQSVPVVNDSGMISNQQQQIHSRRPMIHQQQQPQQHQFTAGPAPVQPPRSPSVSMGSFTSAGMASSQQALPPGSTVVHSGSVPQRIYIQHQPDNVHSQTAQLQQIQNHSQVQQPRQQQHFVSVPAGQQHSSQQISVQPSHQILISGNNTLAPTQLIQHQVSSQLPHQSHQQISASPQQQQQQQPPPIYIGSQRFYTNSVLSATAAVSSNSLHSGYGDGVLVAAALPPPPSAQLASVSEIDLTTSSGGLQPKEMYRELKRKFKYLVYENEYYQEELRNLQRKLLKLSRDKNFLLDRLGSYEIVSDSSDDSDASIKTVEDRPVKIRRRNTANKVVSRKRGSAVLNGNAATPNSNVSINGSTTSNVKRGSTGSASNPTTVLNSSSTALTTSKVKTVLPGLVSTIEPIILDSPHPYSQPNYDHLQQQQQLTHSQVQKKSVTTTEPPSRSSSTSSANFNANDSLPHHVIPSQYIGVNSAEIVGRTPIGMSANVIPRQPPASSRRKSLASAAAAAVAAASNLQYMPVNSSSVYSVSSSVPGHTLLLDSDPINNTNTSTVTSYVSRATSSTLQGINETAENVKISRSKSGLNISSNSNEFDMSDGDNLSRSGVNSDFGEYIESNLPLKSNFTPIKVPPATITAPPLNVGPQQPGNLATDCLENKLIVTTNDGISREKFVTKPNGGEVTTACGAGDNY